MKGGLVTLGDYSFSGILNSEITSGNIPTVEQIGDASVGGFIFLIKFPRPIPALISVYPGTATIISTTSNLILKIIQIGRVRGEGRNGKEITTRNLFNTEVQTQNNIYAGSLDYCLEPICPKIIKSGTILSNKSYPPLLTSIFRLCGFIQPVIGHGHALIDLGFIFMELLENAHDVADAFRPQVVMGNRPAPVLVLPQNLSQIQNNLLTNFSIDF